MTRTAGEQAQQPQRSHFVEIKNCDDCPYKEYGLRKCEEADRWFDEGEYFEPENEIPKWCPKIVTSASRQRIEQIVKIINEYEGELSDGYDYYGGQESVKKLAEAIALLQAGRT